MRVSNVKDEDLKYLLSIEQIISSINKDNTQILAVSTNKILKEKFSSYLIIFQLIYIDFVAQMKDTSMYFDYLKELGEILKIKIFDLFGKFLLKLETNESYFLLEKMIEQELIQPCLIKPLKTLYFAHYKTQGEIQNILDEDNLFHRQFIKDMEKLSKDNWKLHKQLVKEGVNPAEIIKVIRNDDIENLKEYIDKYSINSIQNVEPSTYERCGYINQSGVSLIDYCAYFGSVKCFKYLFINGKSTKNTPKYVVAGGNIEIINTCIDNISKSRNLELYETAIEFHRNDVFYYLYDNAIAGKGDFNRMKLKCIRYNNFEIFCYLMEKESKIYDSIIKSSAILGNIFLLRYLIKNSNLPKYILFFALESNNIDIVNYILEQKEINVNSFDVFNPFSESNTIFIIFLINI